LTAILTANPVDDHGRWHMMDADNPHSYGHFGPAWKAVDGYRTILNTAGATLAGSNPAVRTSGTNKAVRPWRMGEFCLSANPMHVSAEPYSREF
jgi:hypothetical protein